MNSTTSFDFTSLSMNCSMLIFASFRLSSSGRHQPVKPDTAYIGTPNRSASKAKWQKAGMRRAGPQDSGHRYHNPQEAFILHGSSYLGRTDAGEPIRRCNVLSPDR